MANTYQGNPLNSPRDELRFKIGDTDRASYWLEDGEIDYLIAENPTSVLLAAIAGCRAILNKMAQQPDQSVGGVSVHYGGNTSAMVKNVLQQLRQELATSGDIAPYAGGISINDKAANLGPDTVPPTFYVKMLKPSYWEGDAGANPDAALDNEVLSDDAGADEG